VATKVGLFGFDLTDFLADCAMASALCTEKDFKKFSGWAIGVQFTMTAAAADASIAGVCFESSKNCVQIVTSTLTSYSV
jgi:hypothetical protein